MNLFKKIFKAEEPLLTLQYNEKELVFILEGLSKNQPDWIFAGHENFSAADDNKRMILAQLVEQGLAEFDGTMVRLIHDNLYQAPPDDIVMLELGEPYRQGIQIDGKSMLHEPDFRYSYSFIDGAGRVIAGIRRIGCFLQYGQQRFLLNEGQYRLLSAIDEFNSQSKHDKQYATNLFSFANIKGFAQEAGAQLDNYLHKEQAVKADKVSIAVQFIDDDTIEIKPVVDGVEAETFTAVVDQYRDVQNVYDLPQADGGRLRVVLSPTVQEGLREIKQVRRLKGKAKDAFLQQPQAMLDPDLVDLTPIIELGLYSQRVAEIGEFKPRFFPFASPVKNQWLPERDEEQTVTVVNTGNEPVLPIENIADLDEVTALFKDAKAQNEDQFTWRGHAIPVRSEIEQELAQLSINLVRPESPAKNEQPKASKKVLLVKDNIENVDFAVHSGTTKAQAAIELPTNLRDHITLLHHQYVGLGWLQSQFVGRIGGGLLADDMGLGKTLQVLSFLSWYLDQPEAKPVLIVAPVALLENWQEEYEKFFHNTLPMLSLHGSTLSALRLKKSWSGREYDGEPRILLRTDEIGKYPIVLTTYEAVRDYQFSLGKLDWGIVVTDESQKIKTPGTLVTQAAKALKADFRIACTATPVENTLVDLWCILDYAIPGCIGSLKDFVKTYEYPLRNSDTDREKLVAALRQEVEPFLLRRLKQDILKDLPPKYEYTVAVPLSTVQKQQYEDVVAGYGALKDQDRRGVILKVLQQIRDICALPEISEDKFLSADKEEIYRLCPKTAKLVELLKNIRQKNEKVIVFTEQRRLQRLLALVIRREFGLVPSIVNGEVDGTAKVHSARPTRKALVDSFQNKPGFNVIIMSPQAAGFGLNIIGANHVIHYTRLWNPAKEDQATDRVYRIGQTKPVHVYYLVAIDSDKGFVTFDQRLDELLTKKRNLATDFLEPSEGREASAEDFVDILGTGISCEEKALTLEHLDSMKPLLFEAAIAALYEKMGYVTQVTPGSGDYGVDVICLPRNSDESGIVIQCKQGKKPLGIEAVQEVAGALNFYSDTYLAAFKPMVISNCNFSESAIKMAGRSNVVLIDRQALMPLLTKFPITYSDVLKKEQSRLKKMK